MQKNPALKTRVHKNLYGVSCAEPSLMALFLYNENVARWRICGLVSQGIFQNTVAPSSPSDSQCLWHHVLSAISYVFMTQVVFEAMLATIDSGKLCISSRIWGQPNILNITKKKFLSQLNSVIDLRGFPGGKVVKNPPTNTGDASSILGLGRSPGEGNGNALQYSCLGNPLDRGA